MAKLEIEIQPEEEVRLQNLARDQGLTLAEYVRQALLGNGTGEKVIFSGDTTQEPIWKKTERIALHIPPEVRSAVPKDGSRKYKRYLYGEGQAGE